MRIAANVMLGERVVPADGRVVIAEPVAPVVAAAAKLSLPGLRLEGERVGVKAEVTPTDVDGKIFTRGTDDASAVAVGRVDPVVQPVLKSVHAMLLVALDESGEEYFGFVSPEIAVGVAGEQDVRCSTDEDAVAPRYHTARVRQGVEENGRVVVASVIISIFKNAYTATRFSIVVQAKRVVGHLHNPQTSVLVPLKRHRIHHERLVDHEFHLESG